MFIKTDFSHAANGARNYPPTTHATSFRNAISNLKDSSSSGDRWQHASPLERGYKRSEVKVIFLPSYSICALPREEGFN